MFLHFVPVAWFSSMKIVNALNMGVYEGEENRIVGTEQMFVHQRVEDAATEQFSPLLDPEAVRDCLEEFSGPQMRDIDGTA